MKCLSFLVERARPARSRPLPLQASPSERLRLTAQFWCLDTRPHAFVLLDETPDETSIVVARVSARCDEAPGLLAIEARLQPLGQPGWHRLHLQLDGAPIGQSKRVQVVADRRPARIRYKGRGGPSTHEPELPMAYRPKARRAHSRKSE